MKYLVKIALGLFVYMAAVASCKDETIVVLPDSL